MLENILNLYPSYTSVLGPYHRKDGRQHIVLNNENASKGTKGKTKTISYPKALKEIELGRVLVSGETVDHHDRNFNNNLPDNLKVKILATHASEDARRVKVEPLDCPECGTSFVPSKDQRNSHNTEIAGPFCGKVCSGKYGARVQNGGNRLGRGKIVKTYYQQEKPT